MQTYQDVIETVEYEWREIGHEYGGRTLDAETTARRIWRYLAKDGTLKELKAEERQWRREETTHLTVLDWFSSFEPTTVEQCPNHGGAFDCTPFCALCAGDQEIREN